jgi:sulfate permease, SulP family
MRMQFLSQYFKKYFLGDLLSGLTTSFAAIALGAAFGVESGRGAFAGMIAAAIIPIVTSILGGTRLQASGPTGPMTTVAKVVILGFAYSEFSRFSLEAEKLVTLTFLLASIFMIFGGIFRLGKLISLVPYIVLIGFMNGIALIIWLDQLKKIFGFSGLKITFGSFVVFNMKSVEALRGNLTQTLVFVFVTLFLLFCLPLLFNLFKIPKKISQYIPVTLVVVLILTFIASLFSLDLQKVSMGQIPKNPTDLIKIANDFFPNISFLKQLNLSIWLKVLQYSMQLALLGYLDSLLTSLVIDNLVQEKTNKNKELIAQGLANILSALFGGIPGAQATIRSVLLINEGAKTRMAGVFVGIFTFVGIFVLKDFIASVSYVIFVGILIKAGWDVFESQYFMDLYKNNFTKQRSLQLFLVIYTSLVTVLFDLNLAVFSGTIIFFLLRKYFGLKDIKNQQTLVLEG